MSSKEVDDLLECIPEILDFSEAMAKLVLSAATDAGMSPATFSIAIPVMVNEWIDYTAKEDQKLVAIELICDMIKGFASRKQAARNSEGATLN